MKEPMAIEIELKGLLENGKHLLGMKATEEIEQEQIEELYKIQNLCNEWKISLDDLVIYFIKHLTYAEAERIIDRMDLSGIRALFSIED